MAIRISSVSREYVLVNVHAERDNGKVDPTQYPVEFAFIEQDNNRGSTDTQEPDSSDWVKGSWETDEAGNTYAKTLVGSNSASPLTDGNWNVWVRVSAPPERPARKVDILTVT